MSKAILSLSGGLDSAVLLAYMVNHGTNPKDMTCVSFMYGSKHNHFEQVCARQLAEHYKVNFMTVDLSQIMGNFKSTLLLSGGAIPTGHYEAESMKATVVPGRNLIFASILAGFAQSLDARYVCLGVHAGDHYIYPDCRPLFIDSLRSVIMASSENNVSVHAPFLNMIKAKIVQMGGMLKVPFGITRTCYANQPVACGRCGACQERLAAFFELKVEDPIQYETRTILPKEKV